MPPKNRQIKKQVGKLKDTRTGTKPGPEKFDIPFVIPSEVLGEQPKEILLSIEEIKFIDNIVVHGMNRTQAYHEIFPECTRESATASASRMLSRVNVQAALNAKYDETGLTIARATQKLVQYANGSIKPFLQPGPDDFYYIDLSRPEAQEMMYMIKDIEIKRERRVSGMEIRINPETDESEEVPIEWEGEWVKIRLHNAYEALIDYLKLRGQFTKKVDLTSGGEPLPASIVKVYLPDNGRDGDSGGNSNQT